MPTNYPGDPTATEAPSVSPLDDNGITVALPADGDNENAATWAQAYKVLADFVAFLRRPRAKISAWPLAIQRWQNARLQDRFTVDHMGFPTGQWFGWTEYWKGGESQIVTATKTFGLGCHRWFGNVQNLNSDSAGIVFSQGHLLIGIGTGADFSALWGDAVSIFRNLDGCALEWTATNVDTGVDKCQLVFGMQSKVFGAMFGTAVGAWFYKTNASANWFAVCGDGVALSTPVDTGVSAATAGIFKMRVEWLGSGTSDDSTAAARFYINGTLVASITGAHLPSGGVNTDLCPVFGVSRDTGVVTRTWTVGITRLNVNQTQ